MIRVGWLADQVGYVGGGELTAAEFRAAAPDDVDIVPCPVGEVVEGLDIYLLHNVATYSLLDLEPIRHALAFKYHNDVGNWLAEAVRKVLDDHATPICCSPLQQEYMGITVAHLIPPPIRLQRFEAMGARANGNRSGIVCVGNWRNLGKGPDKVLKWAEEQGVKVDFYGAGAFAPPGSEVVPYARMPVLLARYETFVHLPRVIEPFGRLVVEAWAAGCAIVTNHLVGACYWIAEKPDALRTAADDYWRLVLGRECPT